jgi:hypothetical protein
MDKIKTNNIPNQRKGRTRTKGKRNDKKYACKMMV